MVMHPKARAWWAAVAAAAAFVGGLQARDVDQQAPAGCRVTGRVTSEVAALAPPGGRGRGGAEPSPPQPPRTATLPVSGAAILVHQGDRLVVATSADADGRFSIVFTPAQTFRVSAEMAVFQSVEKTLTLGQPPCDSTLDFSLALVPRDQPIATAASTASDTPAATAAPGAGATATAPGRFMQLSVQSDPTVTASIDAALPAQPAELARLLPPGFSVEAAASDALSISARGDAISVDRSVLNERMGAIGRGEFDPETGQFSPGFNAASPEEGFGQLSGRGAGLNAQGRGGGAGRGGFALGGRGGRGQNRFQGSANYSFGGSALDATNFQPRNGVVTPISRRPYARNNFGGTFGGPLVIPGLYANASRRTSFQLNYSGNHSTSLQDQYTTVPTLAMRNGDFSHSAIQLFNPRTGQPFDDNRIPRDQMSPAALALLGFIPEPNVDGTTTQNFHTAATTLSRSNSVSLRVTQNLTPNLPQAGAPGGRGAGRGGGAGGGGRGAGRGGRGLTINLTAQLQYRGNQSDQFNVFPQLGGTTRGSSLTVPITLTIAKGRVNNTIAVTVARSSSRTANGFANAVDAAGLAGIAYPSPQDPSNWGVPNLSFSNFNLRSNAANARSDLRTTIGYTLSRPAGRHQLRAGGEFRRDASSSMSNGNARGTFTFTGLHSSQGALISRSSGADIADFLLGLPQQATLQVAGLTRLRQKAFALYLEDNWQRSNRLTFNLGVRWEVPFPYTEAGGRMANLDVTPDFTAAAVVTPGATGPVSQRQFPAALLRTDWHNVGPRLGMAFRLARGTVLHSSYSITYNTTSYSSIAQRLVAQPPFADTLTNAGSLDEPLTIETGFLGGDGVTNNFGIDPRYGLGMIQTWNATVTRTFWRIWTAAGGYTGTRGTSLDLMRAPNRNADGTLRIDGVQPFTWESSGGRSLLSLGSLSIQRGMANGLRVGATYTLAKSMDNASSLGAGGAVVAQNDRDLDAEYALSNFDRRHQFSANVTWELPFGVGRKWLADGGTLAALVGEWSMTLNVSAETGAPFTPRVFGATTSVASGTSGSLRADYLNLPIDLDEPTLLHFFNTDAFAAPPIGAFGTSPRNVIIGPGGSVASAQFSRDMRIGGTRSVGLTINANNLFNTTRWSAIDTNVNSNTFGQVTRFAPMRTITLSTRLRF
jgi:hypothetical protein